ncbi:disease resistance protein rga2 [Hordeum vulgare]|nr:disease resistance protein rga2 [Hordeum vulgare]
MPWAEFDINVTSEARVIFQAATTTIIGNGDTILFWEDKWLHVNRVQDMAPNIYEVTAPRKMASRIVRQAFQDKTWARDVGPNLKNIEEYPMLWNRVAEVELHEERKDFIRWAQEANGNYSIRSTYATKFIGREVAPYANFV